MKIKPNEFTNVITGEIRAEMARQKLGVADLASALGMSRRGLFSRLYDQINLSPGEIYSITKLLRISPAELMRRAEVRVAVEDSALTRQPVNTVV